MCRSRLENYRKHNGIDTEIGTHRKTNQKTKNTPVIMFRLTFDRILVRGAAMICYEMFTCDAAFTWSRTFLYGYNYGGEKTFLHKVWLECLVLTRMHQTRINSVFYAKAKRYLHWQQLVFQWRNWLDNFLRVHSNASVHCPGAGTMTQNWRRRRKASIHFLLALCVMLR